MPSMTTRHFSAPMAYPYLLYLVEKVASTPIAVRMPSMVGECTCRSADARDGQEPVSVQKRALFAAAMLACSSSQIRYAQEVREYALAVLAATILIYLFLRWETAGARDPSALVAIYSFVSCASRSIWAGSVVRPPFSPAIAIRLLWVRETRFRASHLALATASLGVGSCSVAATDASLSVSCCWCALVSCRGLL